MYITRLMMISPLLACAVFVAIPFCLRVLTWLVSLGVARSSPASVDCGVCCKGCNQVLCFHHSVLEPRPFISELLSLCRKQVPLPRPVVRHPFTGPKSKNGFGDTSYSKSKTFDGNGYKHVIPYSSPFFLSTMRLQSSHRGTKSFIVLIM